MERTEIGPGTAQNARGAPWRGRGPAAWVYFFGPPLVALTVISAALGVRTFNQSLGWVAHTREVRESLSSALSSLLDAEAAQRGYILTREPSFAEQFAAARTRLPTELESLRRLTADNPAQQAILRDLRSLVDRRLDLMDRVVALERRGSTQEALALVRTGGGRRLTEAIRERVRRMQDAEERLLQERTALGQRGMHSVVVSIIGTGLMAFALIALLRYLAAREQRQRAVREAQLAEQARLLDLSSDAIIVRDSGDHVRYWSHGAVKLYGYSREETLGRVTHDLLRTESAEPLQVIREKLERNGRWQGELQHCTRSGQRITTFSTWTLARDEAGRAHTILEANNDITARKVAEESLQNSRERLEFAVRAGKIGFWEWDPQTNRAQWNEQEFELLGLTPTADGLVAASAFFERVLAEDRALLEANLTAAFARGGEFSQEFRVSHRERGIRWLAGRGRVIQGAGGAGARLIGLNWDITDVKNAQAELERSNRSLEQLTAQLELRVAERTRQLSEANTELEAFARSVAHDLRAPLRTMQGFATALIEDYATELPEEGQSFAQRIATAAERMDRLILDLLDYARLSREEVQLEPVLLEPVLRTVSAELASDMQRTGAQLSTRVAALAVRANRTLLTQVLSNLISNATKFVPAGTQPQVKVFAESEGERVRVWVIDNGIGIAPEHHERIFGVFERLHGFETYPGTGIGLAIVRRAVERMGGQAGVLSEVGRGSRFWFELAAAQVGGSPAAQGARTSAEAT